MKNFFSSLSLATLLMCCVSKVFPQNPSLVVDLNTIPGLQSPVAAVATSNGNVYYSSYNLTQGSYSLSRTDGNSTVMLKQDYFDNFFFLNNAALEINGTLFFKATTAQFGTEIWKTDGTPEGTVLLKNIVYASQSNYSNFMKNVNGTLFFGVDNDDAGVPFQLWKSNGTSDGTVMIKDLAAASPSLQGISNYAVLNNKLIFTGYSPDIGYELWVSDGTEAGTFNLKDIYAGGNNSSEPGAFVNLNGILYFTAKNATGRGLWKTDGTIAGTVMVKDLDPSSTTETTGSAVVYSNHILLNVGTAATGSELWISDGTTAGTQLLKDILPGTGSSAPTGFTQVGNALLFIANDGTHGNELWKTDGTSSGTQLVKDIKPGNGQSNPHVKDLSTSITYAASAINGKGYFFANNGVNGYEPWVTDGTAAGTFMLVDAKTGSPNSNVDDLFYPLSSGNIAFRASHTTANKDLWVTDGTAAGTTDLSSSVPGIPKDVLFLANGSKLYFTENDLNVFNWKTFWSTDGTVVGTSQIPLVASGNQSSGAGNLHQLSPGNYITFANDGTLGTSVYYTNGTAAGTVKIKNFYYPPVFYLPAVSISNTGINGKLFLTTQDPEGGSLWVTDGTVSGTQKVLTADVNFNWGTASLNGIFYFTSGSTYNNDEIWRSDGTAAGTYQVTQLGLAGTDHVTGFAAYNNEIYFSALGGGNNTVQLWKTNGTAAGTSLVKSFGQYSSTGDIAEYKVYNGLLYFVINDGVNGTELWSTNGTAAGTSLLKNIAGGPVSSIPSALTVSGNYLFFRASTNSFGKELWRTDGTESGTILLKDIFAGTEEGYPSSLTDVNGILFFQAEDAEGYGLWKSDGTEAGTVKVFAFVSGASITQMFNVDGNAYFVGYHDEASLWRTDGTACHTQQINFSGVEIPGGFGPFTVGPSNVLYFMGSTPPTGAELYKYITSPIGNIEICNGFDDDCNGLTDDNPSVAVTPSGTIEICKGTPVTFTTEPDPDLAFQWSKNGNAIAGAIKNTFIAGANASGDFAVTVNGLNGCTATSDATTLDRLSLPAAMITPLGSLDICAAGSVDLQASSGSQYLYQWNKNNQPIAGATNQLYHAAAIGNYSVKVTNANGCSKISKKVTVTSSCKQDDLRLNEFIELYPNPASTVLNVKTSTENSGTMMIMNSIGRFIFYQSFHSGEMKIDISSFPPGVYVLQLRSDYEIHSQKFVKQ